MMTGTGTGGAGYCQQVARRASNLLPGLCSCRHPNALLSGLCMLWCRVVDDTVDEAVAPDAPRVTRAALAISRYELDSGVQCA